MIDHPSDLLAADLLADVSLRDAVDQTLEVPRMLDVLPDGRQVVVIGDVKGAAEFNHKQGDNPFGVAQNCGLVSCENVMHQFGVHRTEADIVSFARDMRLCEPDGATTLWHQVAVLNLYGVPAHVAAPLTVEMLASEIESGRGVIAALNAGVLWNDASAFDNGAPNHAINVSGVARCPVTGELLGFYINDSGTGDSGKFIDIDTFHFAWSPMGGGAAVVTDAARSFAVRPMV